MSPQSLGFVGSAASPANEKPGFLAFGFYVETGRPAQGLDMTVIDATVSESGDYIRQRRRASTSVRETRATQPLGMAWNAPGPRYQPPKG
jgi:hypothetical protein